MLVAGLFFINIALVIIILILLSVIKDYKKGMDRLGHIRLRDIVGSKR